MLTYKEYEKTVFDWLMSKRKQDSSFTFSLRQKASPGAELDYFIGTENSNYFGTTFWKIPAPYPGASMDLIDVFFVTNKFGKFYYYFEFNVTKQPNDTQIQIALDFIRALRPLLSEKMVISNASDEQHKMETFRIKSKKEAYVNIEEMLKDLDNDLATLIPIVDSELDRLKNEYPIFVGSRINEEEFSIMLSRLEDRVAKQEVAGAGSSYFAKTIEHLKNALNEDPLSHGKFAFRTIKRIPKEKDNYVWIEVAENLIENELAHYEISSGKAGGLYTVDLHFEDEAENKKGRFREITDNLPDQLTLIPSWFKGTSVRYGRGSDPDNPELVSDLKDHLVHMNNLLGKKVRDIIQGAETTEKRDMENPLNLILFGPPGTGKTYHTINKALEIIGEETKGRTRQELKNIYDSKVKDGQIVFTTFHQSMSYEDFIEGIKPSMDQESKSELAYEVVPGIFKRICSTASGGQQNFEEKIEWLKSECSEIDSKDPVTIKTAGSEFNISYRGGKTFRVKPKASNNPESDYPASIENIRKVYEGGSRRDVYNPTYVSGILDYLYTHGLQKNNAKYVNAKPYVLIIDEINRGNVSQIFGELITLIEEDKRIGKLEALEVLLPYSKSMFGVPSNIYIIGTMNTADRSVEALDAALRRRFSFEEMSPQPDLLTNSVEGIELRKLLEVINLRIEKLLDKDHQIGHAYFLGVKNMKELELAMYHKIIPLLQEYFFGDYGKVGLVLGDGFVKVQDVPNKGNIFADFDYDYSSEFNERAVYTIIDYRKQTSQVDGLTFEKAIKKLVKID
jgi:hypothetical protein